MFAPLKYFALIAAAFLFVFGILPIGVSAVYGGNPHLSTQAYDIWVASVVRGMRKALACEPMTDAGRSSLN